MACRAVQILSATADIIIITTRVEDITTTITMDISMVAGIPAAGILADIMMGEDFPEVGTRVVDTMGVVAVEEEAAAMEEVAD